jgi:hypothetical protein
MGAALAIVAQIAATDEPARALVLSSSHMHASGV